MVFKFWKQTPKTLSWKDIDRVVVKLGAVYLGNKGDHRKYNRVVNETTHVIVFPEYKDCGQDIIKNVIRMSGVSSNDFWAVYNGAKYVTGKGIEFIK